MGRLQVAAFAYPGSKQMEAGVVLVVSVSKEDGSPVTGLTATNFRVQVLYDLYAASDATAVDATSFEELAKPGGPVPNSLPGTYRLILHPSHQFDAQAPRSARVTCVRGAFLLRCSALFAFFAFASCAS